MIKQKILITCFLLGSLSLRLQAQTNVTSGGEATGSDGKVSYSIGQTDFNFHSGPDGSVSEGVQQPFEIFIITGIDNKEINITSSVYPNPTADLITISIENDVKDKITYEIADVSGKILSRKFLKENQTTVSLAEYPGSIYYVKIYNDKTELKAFKIIKNK